LRAAVDLKAMGERQIKIDCDVIQADGGTRTAAITGSYVALHMAFNALVKKGTLPAIPLQEAVAAISCGIYKGVPVLDLDYAEDSAAEVDANFILTSEGKIVEIQSTAESHPFEEESFNAMLALAQQGVQSIVRIQREALNLLP
jgi:ribonuclease PH